MKAVSSAQMRDLEQRIQQSEGITSGILMERAGQGVADAVMRLASDRTNHCRIALVAGRGNNGGDVFVAARHLHQAGIPTQVWLAGEAKDLRGDALNAWENMLKAKVPAKDLGRESDWEALCSLDTMPPDIVVDGLLGTGLQGAAKGVTAAAIRALNKLANHAWVIAVDIPSGMDSDSGRAEGDVVQADLTLTIGYPKTGLLQPTALDTVGTIDVIDIGMPVEPDLTTGSAAELPELVTKREVSTILHQRQRQTHKGDYGHVLIVGGAPGYSGAISLAACAACRSGAGRVTVLTPPDLVIPVATRVPEAMVHAGLTTPTGSLAGKAISERFGKELDSFSAILIGPGLSGHRDGLELLRTVLRSPAAGVVLDADALNLIATQTGLLTALQRDGVIITPHAGEMARLLHTDVADIETQRWRHTRSAARHFRTVTVLKGSATVIDDGYRQAMNYTGNPGMATAGMGDILAGITVALAGQGIEAFEAACSAVYLHGSAGDNAARQTSQAGLTATAVLEALPGTFRLIHPR